MKRFLLLVLMSLLFANAGFAKPQTMQEWFIDQKLDQIYALYKEDKDQEVYNQLAQLKNKILDLENYHLMARYYSLLIGVSGSTVNKDKELENRINGMIINYVNYEPDSTITVQAEVNLAFFYYLRGESGGVQIVASSALNTIASLEKQKKDTSEIQHQKSKLHAYLGAVYYLTNRPALALNHFKKALINVDDGFSEAAIAQIKARIAELKTQLPVKLSPHKIGSCISTEATSKEQLDSCLMKADLAQLYVNQKQAETILREMTVSTKIDKKKGSFLNRLPDEHLPAVLSLHLLLVQKYGAENPAIFETAELVTNKIVLTDVRTAALIPAKAFSTLLKNSSFDRGIADLYGVIARQASRDGFDDLAVRFLAFRVKLSEIGLENASDATSKHDMQIESALILLDASSLTNLNGYNGLSQKYKTYAESAIDIVEKEPFFDLFKHVTRYLSIRRGYTFPSPGAVTELLGLIGARNKNPEGDVASALAIEAWIYSEFELRGNKMGAKALADKYIAALKETNGSKSMLARLLTLRGDLIDDALEKSKIYRKSLELFRLEEGNQKQQIKILLRLADNAVSTGDYDTAFSVFSEARELAESVKDMDLWAASQLKIWASILAERTNNPSEDIRLSEEALAVFSQATEYDEKTTSIHIFERQNEIPMFAARIAAEHLASLYAAAGRMDEARALFKKYVFVGSSHPFFGERQAMMAQYEAINLEAVYAPNLEVLERSGRVSELSKKTAARDKELARLFIRAESIVRYGMGEGFAALVAGREALAARPNFDTEKSKLTEDRQLLETLVGSSFLAANQAEVKQ